jgi:tetratricopeptide (TPR) repeat protein
MLRTFGDAFPYVHIFIVGNDFICLGSMSPMIHSGEALSRQLSQLASDKTLKRINISTPFDLLVGYYASFPDDVDMFNTTLRNTDDNSWLEYRAPLEMYQGLSDDPILPNQAVIMPRYMSLFFADRSANDVVLGIANAIAKNRPAAIARLNEMAGWVEKQQLKSQLTQIRNEAGARLNRTQTQKKLIKECYDAFAFNQFDHAKQLLGDPSFLENPEKEYFRLKGRALMGLGELPEALSYFEKAIAANPDDYEAMAFLGLLCLTHGRAEEGVQFLHNSLELNPYHFVPRSYLIGWYDRDNNAAARRELLRSARRLFSRAQHQEFLENLKMTQDDEFLDYAHYKAHAPPAR